MKKKTFRETPATAPGRGREFVPPLTVSHPQLLVSGSDEKFREMLYLMVFGFGRLQSFREAFGRAISLTASQFVVLIGTARRQGSDGVSIRDLSDHTHLAATHVTTEVGKLIGKGLLTKSAPMCAIGAACSRPLVTRGRSGDPRNHAFPPCRVNDILFQTRDCQGLSNDHGIPVCLRTGSIRVRSD